MLALLGGSSWPRRAAWLVVALPLVLVAARASAASVPALGGRVNDYAELLGPDVEQRLDQRLAAYEQKTGHQIAVLTIAGLDGDPIEDFGIRVGEAWKLGRKGHDDGAVLIVALGDRAARIEVGYGLEGDLPVALAGRFIREGLVPAFRRG
jgi:uncharacterized protein